MPEDHARALADAIVDMKERSILCERCQNITEASPCTICGKTPGAPHVAATRAAHLDHLTRYGWSGMCPAPAA